MHTRHGGQWTLAALVGWLALSTMVAYSQPPYTLDRLPDDMIPLAMNNGGDVAGYGYIWGGAMVRLNGVMIDLGGSFAFDINDHQQVVGWLYFGGPAWADLWSPQGGPVALPVPPGDWWADARAINNHGTILGLIRPSWECSEPSEVQWGCGFPVAVFWTPQPDGTYAITELPGDRANPQAINDQGIGVGYAYDGPWWGTVRAVAWAPDGTMTDLGALGEEGAAAYGISTTGEIVGSSSLPEGWPGGAFSWTPAGGMVRLPDPPAMADGLPLSVNAAGVRVGQAWHTERFGLQAVIWDADGTPHGLETPDGPLHTAHDVNESGQIVAYGYYPYVPNAPRIFAYVLTPVSKPEPIPAPVADATATPPHGTAPLKVQFTSQSSGAIDTTLWEFGDGKQSRKAKTSHTYTKPGTYTATLTVEGPGGRDTWSTHIEVTPKPKKAKPQPVAKR